ncbi:MAG: hypothetical protein LBV49_01685 [Azonexus sp.]|jgi:hypothetical protein|nr:hypothetical protein [Azonexus sp.]
MCDGESITRLSRLCPVYQATGVDATDKLLTLGEARARFAKHLLRKTLGEWLFINEKRGAGPVFRMVESLGVQPFTALPATSG